MRRVYATSRDADKREKIAALGATAFEPGARLPERVDVVIETVGAATFDHSLKSTTQGGRIVVSGSTSGHLATVDLRRVFFLQLEIIGSTMGTRDELAAVAALCVARGIRPIIDSVYAVLRRPVRVRAAAAPATSSARSCSTTPVDQGLAR